jgi:hypothetical protein
VEERSVLHVMSQRVLTLTDTFSSDFVSTTEAHVRKDSNKFKKMKNEKTKNEKDKIKREFRVGGENEEVSLMFF